MKKIMLVALFALGLAANASAVVTAGLEAAYLTDNKDPYWAARVGWEFKTSTALSHQVEFELAYTKHEENPIGTLRQRTKLVPIMINYRAETTAANKLGFYFGGGVGQTDVEYDIPGSGVMIISDSGRAFTFQAFVGASYKASPAVTLQAGVKFIRIDEVELFGFDTEVGNDTAITASVNFRF